MRLLEKKLNLRVDTVYFSNATDIFYTKKENRQKALPYIIPENKKVVFIDGALQDTRLVDHETIENLT